MNKVKEGETWLARSHRHIDDAAETDANARMRE